MANAVADCAIIFVNDGFCKLTGFSRAEVMQKPCTCEFLHGPLTSTLGVAALKEAVNSSKEHHVEIMYYKKNGE